MQLEQLQDLYQNSHETVLITDFSLNLLWQNSEFKKFSVTDCRQLFGGTAAGEIHNGSYFARLSGDVYRFSVLRVPDRNQPDTGYLVLSFEDTDAIQSMLRCRDVREYVENYTGEIRQSVTGVAMATNMLYGLLGGEESAAEQTEWLNIIMGHCYRLLKSATSMADTIHNAEQIDVCELIHYTEFLRTFADVCNKLLGGNSRVSCNAAAELYVSAPSSRLLNCLLNILLAARGERSDWDSFSLTAYAEDGFAVAEITASAGEMHSADSQELTSTCPLYAGSEIAADEYLIRRFCEQFGGTVKVRETNVFRCYTLKLPLADLGTNGVCCSKAEQYATDRFSRYHIALSAIRPHKFYQN